MFSEPYSKPCIKHCIQFPSQQTRPPDLLTFNKAPASVKQNKSCFPNIYIYISHHNITIYKVIVSFDTEALHYLYRMMSKSYGYVSEQRKGLIIRFVVIFAATLSFSSM